MDLSREPLAIRAAVVGALTAILHALIVLGVLPIDPEAETAIAGAIDLAALAVVVAWSRGKVTPVADPRLPEAAPAEEDDYEPEHAAPQA